MNTITLDEAAWEDFADQVGRPPVHKPRLAALMAQESTWDETA